MPETTRFAPSPTGWLHLGHAYAAVCAAQAAEGGRFLLRIEDLDAGRCRPAYVRGIYQDLHWLGLQWETPALLQSTRTDAYRLALRRLQQLGVTYPCFCTRREIAVEVARAGEAPHPSGIDSVLYPGTCRAIPSELGEVRMIRERYAIRLDAAKAARLCDELWFQELGQGLGGDEGRVRVDPMLFGDIVLARNDLPASYHLAVVVDDAFQGVTLVTRGRDLSLASHVQVLLYHLLKCQVPRYRHHPLVLDKDGRKLSKRDGSVALRDLRAAGVTASEARSRAHALCGDDSSG
jgi:glutamyl-Q tRNA(Asp) synthetase